MTLALPPKKPASAGCVTGLCPQGSKVVSVDQAAAEKGGLAGRFRASESGACSLEVSLDQKNVADPARSATPLGGIIGPATRGLGGRTGHPINARALAQFLYPMMDFSGSGHRALFARCRSLTSFELRLEHVSSDQNARRISSISNSFAISQSNGWHWPPKPTPVSLLIL